MISGNMKTNFNSVNYFAIKFTFTTLSGKMVIQAHCLVDHRKYLKQILTNPEVNFQLVQQSLNQGEYKVLFKTDDILRIKVGWNILQFTSKSMSDMKRLQEVIQKSTEKQSQLQKVIKSQKRKILQYEDKIAVLMKVAYEHQQQITEMKKSIEQLKEIKIQYKQSVIKHESQEIKMNSIKQKSLFESNLSAQEWMKQIDNKFQLIHLLKRIKDVIKQTSIEYDKIEQLDLSHIKIKKLTPQIKLALQKCKNLRILILFGCGFQSLDNMPTVNLIAIDLTDNKQFFIDNFRLNDEELVKLKHYANLKHLILSQNNIQRIQSLSVLKNLKCLQELDFTQNPISKVEDYREKIFKKFPNLEILDSCDRYGNEKQQIDVEDDNVEIGEQSVKSEYVSNSQDLLNKFDDSLEVDNQQEDSDGCDDSDI